MAKHGDSVITVRRDRPVEIEITEEMIEAGIMALEGTEEASSACQAKSVFRAMLCMLLEGSQDHRL